MTGDGYALGTINSGMQVPIYTLTMAGRAILAFSARDRVEALSFAANGFIRDELASLKEPEGGPLWGGETELMVRDAAPAELAAWEADVPLAIRHQVIESRQEALDDGHFVFLVEYREPDE